MQRVDRVAKSDEIELAQQRLRQRVIQVRTRERVVHQAPQRALTEACGGRINRRQRGRQRLLRPQHVKPGMDHLAAEEARAHFAEGAHPRPCHESLGLAGIEVVEPQHHFAARVLDAAHELAPRPVHDFARAHRALDLHRLPRWRVGDRRNARFVFVAQRQVQHEVEFAQHAEFGELRPQRGISGQALIVSRRRCGRFRLAAALHASTSIASASTTAPRGSSATPTAARAG